MMYPLSYYQRLRQELIQEEIEAAQREPEHVTILAPIKMEKRP